MLAFLRSAALACALAGALSPPAPAQTSIAVGDDLSKLNTAAVVREYTRTAKADAPVMKDLAGVAGLIDVGRVQAGEGLHFNYDTGKKTGKFSWEYTSRKDL